MTSAELKQNKDMFMCPNSGPNGCLISVYACTRRYKLAKKTEDKSGWNVSDTLKDNLEQCIGCKLGEKNQKKYKERKGIDFKTCPCGELFYRQPGENYWAKKKYCDRHSAMNYYERKKDLGKILKEEKGGASMLKKLLEKSEGSLKPTVEAEKDLLGSAGLQGKVKPDVEKEHKLCANEDCKKIFYRKKESKGTWQKRLYCSEKCRKYVENQRKRISRQFAKTKIKNILNSDKPDQVANKKWEELYEMLSVFTDDEKTLEMIKVVAVKVGKSAYKQALIDLGQG